MIVIAYPCQICGAACRPRGLHCSQACRMKSFRIRRGQPLVKRTPLTEANRTQVMQMLAAGRSQRAIANELGMHRRSVERMAMANGTPVTKNTKQSIVQYHKGGKGRTEIARLVGVSLGVVDRAIENYQSNAARTAKAYKCKGCDEAGIYWVTTLKPCVRCAARKGKQ